MKRPLGLSPLLLVVLFAAIVIGALSYGNVILIKPINDEITKNKIKMTTISQQLQLKQIQMKQAQALDVNHLLTNVPSEKKLDQYLTALNGVAKATSCTITSITPSKKAANQKSATANSNKSQSGQTLTLSYDLNVNADNFKDMRAFIRGLENLNRITYVQALHFTGSKTGKQNFIVTLSIFYDPSMTDLGGA